MRAKCACLRVRGRGGERQRIVKKIQDLRRPGFQQIFGTPKLTRVGTFPAALMTGPWDQGGVRVIKYLYQLVFKTQNGLLRKAIPNAMPPDECSERSAGEEQQLSPSATKSISEPIGPPACGWIRNTDLARASGAGLISTSDRHKVLRELSQVRVLLWLR